MLYRLKFEGLLIPPCSEFGVAHCSTFKTHALATESFGAVLKYSCFLFQAAADICMMKLVHEMFP